VVRFHVGLYCMIQNFGGRKFWQNSAQQKLVNNILANAQNWVKITKCSLVRLDITCYITCNVSWSPAWSTCLVWRQWFVCICLVCLCTRWQKKYLKMVFSHSTLYSDRVELFTSSLKLIVLQQRHPRHSHIRVPHIF